MAGNVRTYNCKQVLIALGSHVVTGYAEDSFVTIEKQGDGVMSKVGCDGEIARAIDPNKQFKVKVSLLQVSPSNTWLQSRYDLDCETGNGTFPVLVRDLTGKTVFSSDTAWVVKPTSYGYGKDTTNREWEIDTGEGTIR